VAVEDGHTESVSIKLVKPATREEMLAAWAEFRPLALQHLPMAPEQPIEFAPQDDRPQPRLDKNRGRGMAVTVGRLRPCGLLDWKFTVLSHNTIRGAAGAAILNAELLRSLGKFDPEPPSDRSGALQKKKAFEVGDEIAAGITALLG
jgi:aspartate-semialdehyde dehydrogenase